MIVTLSVLRPLTEEATSWAMPRGRAGVHRVGGVAEHHRGRGRAGLVREQVVLGQHELDLRAGDTLDAADRAGDLALQRALVGDLLLEVGGAELLLVEQLEALARAAVEAHARAGDGHTRLGDLALGDREAGAVVAQLVGDAALVQRRRDLAGLGGVEPGGEQRVRRRAGDPQQQERDADDGHRGDREDPLGAGRQRLEGVDEEGMGQLKPGCGRCPGRPRRPSCGSARRAASRAARARRPSRPRSDPWPEPSASDCAAADASIWLSASDCSDLPSAAPKPAAGAGGIGLGGRVDAAEAVDAELRAGDGEGRDRSASAQQLQRAGEHLLGGLHRGHVRLVGA